MANEKFLKLIGNDNIMSYANVSPKLGGDIKQLPKGFTVNVIVKNILDIKGKIPNSIINLEDVPNFIVGENSIIELLPVDTISAPSKRARLLNPNNQKRQIYENSILIYCLNIRGYASSKITSNLKLLLKSLSAYYLKNINILEYYNLDFKEEYKKDEDYFISPSRRHFSQDTVIYKGEKVSEYTPLILNASENNPGSLPEETRHIVGLSLIAEVLDHICKISNFEFSNFDITSTHRTVWKQEKNYIDKGLTPNYSSVHLAGRAVDFKLYRYPGTSKEYIDVKKISTAEETRNINEYACYLSKALADLPIADQIIREATTTEFSDIFNKGLGWIHLGLSLNPEPKPDKASKGNAQTYEHLDFFEKIVQDAKNVEAIDPAQLEITNPESRQYVTVDVLDALGLGKSSVLSNARERVRFIAMTQLDNKTMAFIPGSEGTRVGYYIEGPKVKTTSRAFAALRRASFQADSLDIVAREVETYKKDSYKDFGNVHLYNFDKDKWEVL